MANENRTQDAGHALLRQGRNPKVRKISDVIGMRAGSVYPERWEERTCGEVLALIDECIHWYDHDRIKQSLGWMSPVQYRLSHELAA